jgi:tetratricopeptide (TPR) repeat protein
MKVKKVFLMFVITGMMVTTWMPTLLFSQLTSGRGRMYGTVTEEGTGQPLEGVTVKLFFPRSNAYHTSEPKTDAAGKWSVNYVRGGLWNLDFVKDGYETKKISFVVDERAGLAKPSIDIQLKKLEGPAAARSILDEINKAVALIAEKKVDQALKELQTIEEKFQGQPGIEIVYLHMGNCYSSKGDYLKAIEFYKKALEKFPNHSELILCIGNAYGNLNDFDTAMEWFNKLKIDDIGNVDTLYNIGVIAYNKGDFDRALTFFKKATEIDPEFSDGLYQLGMTYTALDKPKEAVEVLKKFMQLDPQSPNYESAKAVVEAFEQQ